VWEAAKAILRTVEPQRRRKRRKKNVRRGWEYLHKEELRKLHSRNIISVIK
jgi:hypothetical protein